jgi:hypothetical protein
MAVSPVGRQIKELRVIQLMLLITIILFGVFVKSLQPTNAIKASLNAGLVLIGVVDGALALGLRAKYFGPAESAVLENSADMKAILRWRKMTIACLVLAYSLGIYGFALAMYGAQRAEFLAFFGVSIVLLLLWTPRLALPTER